MDGNVYGTPAEQVVGSAGRLKLVVRDGKPVLIKLAVVSMKNDWKVVYPTLK